MGTVIDMSKASKESISASLTNDLERLSAAHFSPALRDATKLHQELIKRGPDGHFLGGLVHEAVRGPGGKIIGNVVHIANPHQKEPLDIVTLPTRCTKQDIEKIRGKIIPMKETYEILVALAKAYQQRHPILIEGDTSIGKTFIVNRFMELLYGPGARPLDFYCSGQTDVAELLGKWAPKTAGLSDIEKKRLNEFLQSDYGKQKILTVQEELQGAHSLETDSRQALLQNKLSALLESIGLQKSVQWEFSYGAVPKAMMCDVEPGGRVVLPPRGGAGTILKVDEVGLGEPAVIMALLRIRGEASKLTDSIQLWEAGGEIVRAGPDFFVVYTTNPSDKDYLQRKEIDPALARSVIWSRHESLSKESLSMAAHKYLSFSVGNAPKTRPLNCVIDLREEPELTAGLAEVAAVVHERYLELMKSGEPGRRQKLPGSLDHLARLASYMLSEQVRDAKSGSIDISETLRRGVHFVYLAGLTDEKKQETITKELEMLLTSDTVGKKEFRGKEMTRNEIFALLAKEAQEKLPAVKAAVIKRKNSASAAGSQDRQMCNDLSDTLLAQLDTSALSLEKDILPQIETALSMFNEQEVGRELLEEIMNRERPEIRSEEEWNAFTGSLGKLLAQLSNDQEMAA